MNKPKESDLSIFSLISNLQASALERIGISKDQIRTHLLDIFKERLTYDPAKDFDIVEILAAKMPVDDLYVMLRKKLDLENLPYQCPLSAWMLQIWQEAYFEDLATEDTSEIGQSSLGSASNPVLASAFTGQLNAMTLRAPDGTVGIVFEDQLLNLLHVAAAGLAGLVIRVDDEGFSLSIDSIDEIEKNDRFHRSAQLLFGSIWAMLVHGNVHQDSKLFEMPLQTMDEIRLGNKIAEGMFKFVYGHEWAHIMMHHYELRSGTAKRHIPRRKIPEQEKAIEKYHEKYAQTFSLTPIQVQQFLTRQMMEIEADTFANYQNLVRYQNLKEDEDWENFNQLCSIIGSMSILPLFGIIELIAICIAYGADEDYPFALLGEDDLVQNLCLRGTHPSPRNRVANVLDSLNDEATEQFDRTEEYIELFQNLSRILAMAFEHWCASEDIEHELGIGPDALQPNWRGLLEDLPTPLQVRDK